jgi:hypothetical protein
MKKIIIIFIAMIQMTTTAMTTTEATTTANEKYPDGYKKMIIEFPEEFSDNQTVWDNSRPVDKTVDPDKDDDRISEDARQLARDLDKFAKSYLENLYGDEIEDGKAPDEKDGCYLTNNTAHYFGLADLDDDDKPEVFTYRTRGGQGYKEISFFDMYAENPLEPIIKTDVRGFCRDGPTYFAKNESGNVVMLTGYLHSVHMGQIDFYEFTKSDSGEIIADKYFSAEINSFDADELRVDRMFYNGEMKGDVWGYDDIKPSDFYAAFKQSLSGIIYEYYWIYNSTEYCGDEEDFYTGIYAYEKYLEVTTDEN